MTQLEALIPQSHEHFNADWSRDKYYISGLPRDRLHGKRGRFGLNEITRDIFSKILAPTQEVGQMFYPGIKRVTDTISRDILYVWPQNESDTGYTW